MRGANGYARGARHGSYYNVTHASKLGHFRHFAGRCPCKGVFNSLTIRQYSETAAI
jgi:hypothetical protein